MAIRNFDYLKVSSLNKARGCPLDFLCRYCRPDIMRICCLFNNIIKIGLSKCTNYQCCNYYDCNDALIGVIHPEYIPTIRTLKNIDYSIKSVCKGFSNAFIPAIDISPDKNAQNQIKIIKKAGLDTISISIGRLISENKKKIIKDHYRADLHDLLDFDGKIMLTSNIRDNLCEKLLKRTDNYIQELRILNPDIITSFDANFYLNQPLFITLYQMYSILKSNAWLSSINSEQICLIPPMIHPFFEIMISKALQLNYKVLCVPLLEINRDRMKTYRYGLINSLNWFKERNNFKSLLISTNPNNTLLVDNFSSQSWVKIKNSKSLSVTRKERKLERRLRECIVKAKNANLQQNMRRYL